ncbi:peroxiredoxin [Pontiellaceae bacterium B12227]|nr:peroxiredoxin [Pontiellaceae bacterium B12227]
MNKFMIGIIGSIACALSVGALEKGAAAPVFSAKNQDGKEWNLKDHLGGKPIVVYFYPAAMTGGCTKQACAYRDHLKGANPDFTVIGISGDAVQNLKWFQTSENLNFPLLSDPEGAIAESFGVPVKRGEKMIERKVGGETVSLKRSATTSRWTFIIDPAGKIVYKAEQVKATADLADVLKFLKSPE